MPVDYVYLQAPYGGEIREVEATPDVLVPLLVQGWYQVPAPADREATAPIGIIEDAEQSGLSRMRDKKLMVAGWSQCEPPANTQEVTTHVDD